MRLGDCVVCGLESRVNNLINQRVCHATVAHPLCIRERKESDTLQNGANELFDAGFVIGVGSFDLALGDHTANSHCAVSHV